MEYRFCGPAWRAGTATLVLANDFAAHGIVAALFVFFMSFGLNQWLEYRQMGPWKSYAYGEKAYLVLSLGAKSVLAWQVFGPFLAG